MPDSPRRRPKPVARKKPAAAAAKPVPRKKPAAAAAKPAAPDPAAPDPAAPDPARRRAVLWGALLSVLLVGVLFAFVYPTQTFLDQRNATNRARQQLDVLKTESKKLAEAANRLERDEEIARIAREFYGLVKPGERPFVILPAPTVAPEPTTEGSAKPAP